VAQHARGRRPTGPPRCPLEYEAAAGGSLATPPPTHTHGETKRQSCKVANRLARAGKRSALGLGRQRGRRRVSGGGGRGCRWWPKPAKATAYRREPAACERAGRDP
jgi:hypothetical protein